MRDKKAKTTDWVVWFGGVEIGCLRCGAKGTLPTGCSLTLVCRFIEGYCREHRKCLAPSPQEPGGEA